MYFVQSVFQSSRVHTVVTWYCAPFGKTVAFTVPTARIVSASTHSATGEFWQRSIHNAAKKVRKQLVKWTARVWMAVPIQHQSGSPNTETFSVAAESRIKRVRNSHRPFTGRPKRDLNCIALSVSSRRDPEITICFAASQPTVSRSLPLHTYFL
ncbi:hypothetical protein e1012e08.tmp0005 [Eimeria tenella]|uniref:Uncharacterized protein n=1 Tax=Eimeria tenella TaxID=5802 RepID=C8TDJ5_EIMTE|nr:hypothetical protein e1012e08.tmp0005 [Eimeria tenella]